jgi:ring-1,2-phenylacetyl-CoA epoxidase subunit PaaD
VSEAGTQVGIARIRAGSPVAAAAARVDAAAVQAALAEVMDPELPMVSVVDLGMVGAVTVDAASGAISVELLPTFVGCPALGLITAAVADRLARFGVSVAIEPTFRIPWTSDRITPEGRRALATAGIAGPSAPDALCCPYCGSGRVVMDSSFGPTQCRSLHYCRDCRQPFEAMKPV